MKHVLGILVIVAVCLSGCAPCNEEPSAAGQPACGCSGAKAVPKLLVQLPDDCNTPDGCTLDAAGNIILSIPNFNNKALIAAGTIKEPSPARMVMIDKNNKLSTWYEFQEKDLHPDTKLVGPMDCAFGPDGNLYLADNQLFFDGAHKSRLLRINCKDGKAVDCDVVIEGFIVANAVVWHGQTVYVSETVLEHPAKVEEGQPKPPLTSGTYAIGIGEWSNGPVKLQPYSKASQDPHLIAVYETSNRIGFGADGLAFDGDGNLYCGIFEDGIIYKTTFPPDGKPVTTEFARDEEKMSCCDGIIWREADNCIYVADMLRNGVQVVDMQGKVRTLHTNPDTDGASGLLDQPCEVMMRGNELIVVNMDMPWESDLLANKAIDKPYTVSVIDLGACK